MKSRLFIFLLIVFGFCISSTGCLGGGDWGLSNIFFQPHYGLEGPGLVNENSSIIYEVVVPDGSNFTYQWSITPASVATITMPTSRSTELLFGDVTGDTQATVSVTVSDGTDTEVQSIDVTIVDLG
jgi:hypothetical protein